MNEHPVPVQDATSIAWRDPPTDVVLLDGEVHVWHAWLNLPGSDVVRFEQLLSAEEQRRAERFRFNRDRRRFIVARGSLRAILSRYVRQDPDQLRLAYSSRGKPSLVMPSHSQGVLEFNLSRSGDLAVYAVAWGRQVGIDVERIRPFPDAQKIAERFFSARESALLRTLPDSQKVEAFFACWTRKEAYMKASGKGMSLPLAGFDVSAGLREPVEFTASAGDTSHVLPLSMCGVRLGEQYQGALVVGGRACGLQFWRFCVGGNP